MYRHHSEVLGFDRLHIMTNHKLNREEGRTFPYWDGSDVRVSASQADEICRGRGRQEDQDAYDSLLVRAEAVALSGDE